MACYGCPYFENYDLIWRDDAEPDVICVMLWCCAGPELQIRRGNAVMIDEFFPTKTQVYERAEQLRIGGWSNIAAPHPQSASTPT